MEPPIGIYTALTRKGLDGKPDGGWVPGQSVDVETAVKGYTITGAYANFMEGESRVPGAGQVCGPGDALGRLFTIAPEKVKDVNAVWTMVGGKEVWKGF